MCGSGVAPGSGACRQVEEGEQAVAAGLGEEGAKLGLGPENSGFWRVEAQALGTLEADVPRLGSCQGRPRQTDKERVGLSKRLMSG